MTRYFILPIFIILLGAGCVSSSSLILSDVKTYNNDGTSETSIINDENISLITETTQYTSNGRLVDVGVYKEAEPGDAIAFLQRTIAGELEDGFGFKSFAYEQGSVYYGTTKDQGVSCYLLWISGSRVVLITGIESCDQGDDLLRAYTKKYPPTFSRSSPQSST